MFRSRRANIIALRVIGCWTLADLALWGITGNIDRPGFYLHVDGTAGVIVGVIGAGLAFAAAWYLARRPARTASKGDQAV